MGNATNNLKPHLLAKRAQRACAVRGCACSPPRRRAARPAIAKARGPSEAHAGGPRWLRLPEGPAAAPGRRRKPPGARPRGVRWQKVKRD
ncbi:hypothetical protein R6Z07F_011965 [Ovis aries]